MEKSHKNDMKNRNTVPKIQNPSRLKSTNTTTKKCENIDKLNHESWLKNENSTQKLY